MEQNKKAPEEEPIVWLLVKTFLAVVGICYAFIIPIYLIWVVGLKLKEMWKDFNTYPFWLFWKLHKEPIVWTVIAIFVLLAFYIELELQKIGRDRD